MLKSLRDKPWYGTLLVVLAGTFWSFSGVLSKSIQWSGLSRAGIRPIVALFILAWGRKSFKFNLSFGNILAAVCVMLTSVLYMSALTYTTSANAIVIQYGMSIFVLLFNLLLFKKKPTIKETVCVFFVLGGVILCCLEGLGKGSFIGDFLALLSALTYSVVFFAKQMKNTSPEDYTYMGTVLSLLLLVFLPFDPNVHFTATELISWGTVIKEWVIVLVMGASLGFGYLMFTKGMMKTSATAAAIASNVEPVLNPIWVYIFIGENPGVFGIIGAAVVLITITVGSILPDKQKQLG